MNREKFSDIFLWIITNKLRFFVFAFIFCSYCYRIYKFIQTKPVFYIINVENAAINKKFNFKFQKEGKSYAIKINNLTLPNKKQECAQEVIYAVTHAVNQAITSETKVDIRITNNSFFQKYGNVYINERNIESIILKTINTLNFSNKSGLCDILI